MTTPNKCNTGCLATRPRNLHFMTHNDWTTHNDVLSVGMCPKMRPVGVTKKGKKGQKLSCVKLAICPDHPRRHRPLKFCMRGRVWEVVIYFKFHENWSRGLGAVGGRKSSSPIDKAHGLYNSLYYRTSRDILLRAITWVNVTCVFFNHSCLHVFRLTKVHFVDM